MQPANIRIRRSDADLSHDHVSTSYYSYCNST